MIELLSPEFPRTGVRAWRAAATLDRPPLPATLLQVATRPKVKRRRSPGAALAAVAADGLTVAVALLDDHADVGLHQLGDVHDLQRGGRGFQIKGRSFNLIVCMLF